MTNSSIDKLPEIATISYYNPETEQNISLSPEQLTKIISPREFSIVNYGEKYQSLKVNDDIPNYGPCFVCYKDTVWTGLYIGCPTDYCNNSTAFFWYHSSNNLASSYSVGCGGILGVSNKCEVECKKCGTSSFINNWSFSCSNHREYKQINNASFARILAAGDFDNEMIIDLIAYLKSHRG